MSFSRFFPCFQFRLEDNIYKLDYSNNILSEGFPHVWQHERTLEELNVSSTRISYLPPQLFYCQGLKVLLANSNNIDNIPEAIGSLRQLQQLNLSRNFISNVPDNIKSCKNLTHLDLSCNSLLKLPDALTCLISLQELILNETYLEFLPANFGRLVNLRIVELRSNNLVSLPKSMQRLTNLQRLDIGCNEFMKLPEVVGELKQLRELWFDFNQIQSLPLHIGKLRELVHFEATGNCMNFLPSEITNWLNVEVISISINNLTTLPSSIGMLKSLVTLKCESNELTELPFCISNLENLEELVVSHNKLVCLPNTIGMLRKLRYIFADNNLMQKLPDEICSCSALIIISVSQNKLSALPDNLGHLTNLKVLNIVQNNIETLPVSLLSLVNLTSLWISNNQSQPLIPLQYTEISKKTQLTCFMLPQKGNLIKNCIDREPIHSVHMEELKEKAASCSISKRRICFAEETTMLHNEPQISHLSTSRYCQNGNNFDSSNTKKLESKVSMDICGNAEILEEKLYPKDYLMRSPTPYPKELRLMAKYAQLNHQKCLNSNNQNSNEEVPISLQDLANNVLQDERLFIHNKYTPHTTDKTNNDLEDNLYSCSPKPPPYHIARCFTKKSVDDLSKYEFARKQIEHHNNLPVSEISLNRNLLLQNSNTYSEEKPNNDIDKYNLITQQFKQNEVFTNYHISENSDTDTTVPPTTFLDSTNNSDKSNSFSKMKINKKTKWLFGAHKNPRVMQVNVNWENGREIEIDMLPNKEGIFVISTISESNASQLIHPLDKLLEVEGIDFTNISVYEARQVLRNARPSISIMLSRK